MAKLGWTLQQLDRRHTPLHITSVARQSVKTMADALSFPSNLVLRRLLTPKLSGGVLRLLGAKGEVFEPMLHNTVNAIAIRGADSVSVLPERIILHLACMLLPGYSPDDMILELHRIIGDDVELRSSITKKHLLSRTWDSLILWLKYSVRLTPMVFLYPYCSQHLRMAVLSSQLGIQTSVPIPANRLRLFSRCLPDPAKPNK